MCCFVSGGEGMEQGVLKNRSRVPLPIPIGEYHGPSDVSSLRIHPCAWSSWRFRSMISANQSYLWTFTLKIRGPFVVLNRLYAFRFPRTFCHILSSANALYRYVILCCCMAIRVRGILVLIPQFKLISINKTIVFYGALRFTHSVSDGLHHWSGFIALFRSRISFLTLQIQHNK